MWRKLYLFSATDLLPLNCSSPRLINMDSNLPTPPIFPFALLPSILFHASLLLLSHPSFTLFLVEKNSNGPLRSAAGECTLKVLWEGGVEELMKEWLRGCTNTSLILSSLRRVPHPPHQSLSSIFGSALPPIFNISWCISKPDILLTAWCCRKVFVPLFHPFIPCLRLELCD